jgi:hypothetical protein
MLLNNRLNQAESFKVGVPEVPVAIVVSSTVMVAISSFGGDILGLVLSREQSSGQRVVYNNVKTVAPANGD